MTDAEMQRGPAAHRAPNKANRATHSKATTMRASSIQRRAPAPWGSTSPRAGAERRTEPDIPRRRHINRGDVREVPYPRQPLQQPLGTLASAAHPFEFRSLVRVIEVMGLRQRVGRGGAFGRPQGAGEKATACQDAGKRRGWFGQARAYLPFLNGSMRAPVPAGDGSLRASRTARKSSRQNGCWTVHSSTSTRSQAARAASEYVSGRLARAWARAGEGGRGYAVSASSNAN
jgi:hypothetical protein